jgi:high-affinity iron transporter
MEPHSQNDNQEKSAPYFLKWRWWRPIYYFYFAGVVVAVISLYSAGRNRVSGKSQVAAATQAAASTASSQASTEAKEMPAPSQTVSSKKPSAPAANAEEAKERPAEETPETTALPAADAQFADLISPPAAMLAKGKSLFMNDCVACHGANGEGDGPAALALKPKPRNFHSPKGWINGRTASGMYKTLTDGIPGSPMPPFSSISVKDRLAIISYIRSFKGFPRETKADIETLAKMVGNSGGSDQGND